MKNKFKSILGILLGGGILLASLYFRNKLHEILFLAGVILGAVIAILSIAEIVFLLYKRTKSDEGTPENTEKIMPVYARKKALMSKAELEFFETLKLAVNGKYEVIPQVALVSVVDKLTQNQYRNELFRIIDFCIVHKETYAPLLLVELNDSSHNRADRIERDRKVNEICSAAGMPIVAFKMQEIHDVREVMKIISKNALKK